MDLVGCPDVVLPNPTFPANLMGTTEDDPNRVQSVQCEAMRRAGLRVRLDRA